MIMGTGCTCLISDMGHVWIIFTAVPIEGFAVPAPHMTIHLFGFQTFRLWAYLMKVYSETRLAYVSLTHSTRLPNTKCDIYVSVKRHEHHTWVLQTLLGNLSSANPSGEHEFICRPFWGTWVHLQTLLGNLSSSRFSCCSIFSFMCNVL
jgi:hypothetical protein